MDNKQKWNLLSVAIQQCGNPPTILDLQTVMDVVFDEFVFVTVKEAGMLNALRIISSHCTEHPAVKKIADDAIAAATTNETDLQRISQQGQQC